MPIIAAVAAAHKFFVLLLLQQADFEPERAITAAVCSTILLQSAAKRMANYERSASIRSTSPSTGMRLLSA